MAVNLALTLTSDGKGAFWNSRSTGISLDITHIQFGSLNRLTTGEESSLGLPKQYTQIQNGSKIGVDQVRIMATMPGLENYNVAEIGLWSGVPNQAGSILVAYISVATGFIAQMVSGIDLVFTYDMVVSTIDIDHVNIVKDTDQGSTFALLAAHETDRNAHPFYVTTDTAQTISGAKAFTSKAIFSGGLAGELEGNAASATKLKSERIVSFSGAATGSFNYDGSSNSSTILTLANSGVAASTYGGNLKIPVVTVNAKGLITGVSEQNIPIVDNLTTDDATKPVSAKQAKNLQDHKLDKDENAATATKLSTATGVAPSFASRATVNFDGTTGAVRNGQNVSSITSVGYGTYQVNFITAMPTADYAIVTSLSARGDATELGIISQTNTSCTVRANYGGDNTVGSFLPLIACVSIFC